MKKIKGILLLLLAFAVFVAFWDMKPNVHQEEKVLPNATFKQ
ncbi:MAG: hypothetical protein PHI50_01365 [Alphaproteobacteria bacterium]|nr:hypothetical protein [Alphaproteobacteria bacterium]